MGIVLRSSYVTSRMESTGVPGKIQVTEEVTKLVPKEQFKFELRGEVFVKGKGQMNTWFLTERVQTPSTHRLRISVNNMSPAELAAKMGVAE